MSYGGLEDSVPTTSVEIYRDVCKKIDELLKYDDAMKAAFGGSFDSLENAYRIMKEHIELAIQDKELKPQKMEIEKVIQAIDRLRHFYTFDPVTTIGRDFTFSMIELFGSWNDNCVRDRQIGDKISYLSRLFHEHLTMQELCQVLKALTAESRKLLNYEPQSFKLSRAYFGTLQDAMKNEAS